MTKLGLIGHPLEHSFSKKYFEQKFLKEGLEEFSYENYSVEELVELPKDLFGFNVTIPYKQKVIPMLRSIDPTAREVGAVNCVDVNLRGHNTDVVGFRESLLQLIREERPKTLVFGSGGASLAVQYVLKSLGMKCRVVSRKGELNYDNLTMELIEEHKLLINTTPLGTYPDIDSSPDIPYDAIGEKHFIYDLVYNPSYTTFIKNGSRRGAWVKCGIHMLILQAEEAWEIWNNVIKEDE